MERMDFIGTKVTEGAISFLQEEYLYLGIFSAVFAVILGLTVDLTEMSDATHPTSFPFTATAFLIGSGTSILAGYIGMRIAVYTNTRTTFQCCKDIHDGFITAFRGGQVLGFVLVGLALLILDIIIVTFKAGWLDGQIAALPNDIHKNDAVKELVRRLFELVAGYGLGGSSVALFGRVGGGIYTKAADVGADLVGKTLKDLKEDDPSNPGTIADNVGDNVGDIAGMGADLFGSLAESTCAALVVSSTSLDLITKTDALYFPLMITSCGIVASFVSVLFGYAVKVTENNVQGVLKAQIGISTVLMTFTLVPIVYILPQEFTFIAEGGIKLTVTPWLAYGCIIFGLWSGMIIGFTTEYFTSNNYGPTLYLAESCKNGPAPNIIQGLALGYNSCIVPILCLTATIGFSFKYAGMYGIGLSALGMLGSLPVALTIDGYGPISDNAGGIAEMSELPGVIRDKTDALDAAGNTTAAVGKGFAIGSACLVGLALFGAFITRVGAESVNILQPIQFAGLLVGAMLPYAFSAMTMKAVGDAAFKMMDFIIEDFNRTEAARKEGADDTPDYDGCIKISTEASLKKMIAPGALVLGSPLLAGFLFGPDATAGLLAGAIVSGVQVAISASNTGGAWDNAKKEIEKRRSAFRGEAKANGIDLDAYAEEVAAADDEAKESEDIQEKMKWVEKADRLKEQKVAAVVGDTVGDPLKDTSGPSINILIKLSAITSLVFGKYIQENHIFNA
uniref:H(+)-exporting diphosphatase n=1 Tax=Strombidium inclinatum TaxID=197538 RepID=A0A7S3IHU0_9SPIT|mmetsp:Transcript_18296/g.28117  ORF Transcript_18296/g.28117 Transcript_18296/m.28117 type:complete len:733 (+) Transcript_18296:291-2489(+)